MDKIKWYFFPRNISIFFVVLFTIRISAFGATSDLQKAFLDTDAILAGWESKYASIKSMQVSYTQRVLDFKPSIKKPDFSGPTKYQYVERIEKGKRYHIRYSIAEDGFAKPENVLQQAFDGKVTKDYFVGEKSGTIYPGLMGRDVETMNVLKYYMLLDLVQSQTYQEKYPNGIPRFSSLASNSIAKVLPDLEPVADQLCHVIEIVYKTEQLSLAYKIWAAHDKGMLPLKYQRYKNNIAEVEIEVEAIGFTETDSGGIWYPKKAYLTQNSKNLGTMKYELVTHTFVPNVKVDETTFRFDYPNGTRVVDKVLGLNYVTGVKNIEDVPNVQELKMENKEQVAKEATEHTPDLTKSHSEEKSNESELLTDEGQDQMPVDTVPDKDKILGIKTLSILGVIVLTAFGLLFWYKRSANS